MFLVVTYDCRDEKTRGRVRRLLRKYSFTMLTYSVYVGKGSRNLAERLASHLSKLLGEGDRATIILLSDFQYELLVEVAKGAVSLRGERMPVIVFYGVRRARATDEGSGRPGGVQGQGEAEGPGSPSDRNNTSRGTREENVEQSSRGSE